MIRPMASRSRSTTHQTSTAICRYACAARSVARSSASGSRGIRRVRKRSTTSMALFKDFFEIHGDRRFADDGAIVAGLANFDGKPVAIVGQQRGRSTADRIKRNFGKPHPEGYRKAARVYELADRFRPPARSPLSIRKARSPESAPKSAARPRRSRTTWSDGAARSPVDCVRDRRGWFRRRARAGSRQRRADPGERVLLGYHAGRMRRDFMARGHRGKRRARRRSAAALGA